MIRHINLQFFKGGTTVQEVEKREPKSEQLKAMDDAVYNVMGGFLQRYGGVTMPTITTADPYASTNTSNNSSSSSGNRYSISNGRYTSGGSPIYLDSSGRAYTYSNGQRVYMDSQSLANAFGTNGPVTGNLNVGTGTGYNSSGWGEGGYLDTAFDEADRLTALANQNSADLLEKVPEYLDKSDNMLDIAQQYAVDTTENALKFYDNSDWYLDQHKGLLTNGTNAGLENAVAAMNQSVLNELNDSIGAGLSDFAARGIMNSSTANRGIQAIESEAADSTAANWANVYNTMLNNYISGAEASKGLAESTLGTMDNTVNNYATIAQGYRDQYNSGLQGLETFASLPSTYYENALAPLLPAYNTWNQMTQNWLANDKDYVATSDGK